MPYPEGTEMIEHKQWNQEVAETILWLVFTPLDTVSDSIRYGVFFVVRLLIEKVLQVKLTYGGR